VPRVLWRTPHARNKGERPPEVPGKLVARGPVIKVAASDTKPADGEKLVPGSVIRSGDVDRLPDLKAPDPKAVGRGAQDNAVPTAPPAEPAKKAPAKDAAEKSESVPESVAPAEKPESVAPAEKAESEAAARKAESGRAGQAAEPEIPHQGTAPEAAVASAEPEEPGQKAESEEPGQQAEPAESARTAEIAPRDEPAELDREPGRGARVLGAEPATAVGALAPAAQAEEVHDLKWREVKAGFVDDPPAAVELAFGMVEWAVKDLAETVRQRRAASSASNLAPDTEQLRLALLGYRSMFEELRRASERLAQAEHPDARRRASIGRGLWMRVLMP
jgi:hypothetical protein